MIDKGGGTTASEPHSLRLPFNKPPPDLFDSQLVKLTQGKYARISSVDVDRVKQYRWHYSKRKNKTSYARRTIRKTKYTWETVYLHRFIMNPPDELLVDHKDGDGLNCTRENLRIVSTEENNQNLKCHREAEVDDDLGF